ncbi:MAG: 3'(2'),5'-bisphosphate nucleotidase CysQ [Nitrospiria bacterium]
MKEIMDRMSLKNKILPKIILLAEKAGKAIMEVYGDQDFGVTLKADHSPLTRADLAAHRIILSDLQNLTPDIPAISEESEEISYEKRRTWPVYWLIDPLDGTKEFIKRNTGFSVNIAMIREGKPVLGVVHAPALGITFYAVDQSGAFKKVTGQGPIPIHASDYREDKLKVVTSQSHIGGTLERFLETMENYEVLRAGSSIKLCMVAEGSAHLYPRFGKTMEWDTAAAHCIVKEAGGSVTDMQGYPLHYNKTDLENPEFLVRGNPPFPVKKELLLEIRS